MIDPAKTAQQIGLDDPLTEAEWNEVKQDVVRNVRRRKIQRRSAKLLASSLLFGTALLGWKTYPSLQRAVAQEAIPKDSVVAMVPPVQEAMVPLAPNEGPCTLRFPDGSAVNLLNSWSTLLPKDVTSDHIDVELVNGSGRFDIVHDSARHFRVQAGSVLLDVIGTVFTLEKVGEQVTVSVERGSVHLYLPGGDALVSEGQVGIYPAATNGGANGGEEPKAAVFATRIGEPQWW